MLQPRTVHAFITLSAVRIALVSGGVAHWCAFDLSSGPTRYGYFGVEGTPLGDLLDQRRAAQLVETSTPPTVEERLAALEQRVARLESQHAVDKSPLTL